MKVGDLIIYTAFDGKDYMGLVLEHHGTWVLMHWVGLNIVDEFNIGDERDWKVIG